MFCHLVSEFHERHCPYICFAGRAGVITLGTGSVVHRAIPSDELFSSELAARMRHHAKYILVMTGNSG